MPRLTRAASDLCRPFWSVGFRAGCEELITGRSPALRDCFNARTTLVSKSLSVFEGKWLPGKAHAWENIGAPRQRTLTQSREAGLRPSEFGHLPLSHSLFRSWSQKGITIFCCKPCLKLWIVSCL
jgi:hypothetical protein